MSTILYTAIYGGYDDPKPLPAGLDVPAVLFTDSPETAKAAEVAGWMPVVVPHRVATCNGDPAKTGPMLAHKWWKTHPSRVYSAVVEPDLGFVTPDVALWIDGSITPRVADYGAVCLAALGGHDLALTPHPWRDCAIEEGRYSATLPRYQGTGVDRQTEFYAGFHPPHWGLFASGALAWRVNPVTAAFGELWWRECLNWSHQDQVSLPILLRMADTGQLELGGRLDWNRNLLWEQAWTLANHRVAP